MTIKINSALVHAFANRFDHEPGYEDEKLKWAEQEIRTGIVGLCHTITNALLDKGKHDFVIGSSKGLTGCFMPSIYARVPLPHLLPREAEQLYCDQYAALATDPACPLPIHMDDDGVMTIHVTPEMKATHHSRTQKREDLPKRERAMVVTPAIANPERILH